METSYEKDSNLAVRKRSALWRPRFFNNYLSKAEDNTIMEMETVTKEKLKKQEKRWNTIVTIVLVEAINIPPVADDGAQHNLYCKFRLGTESFKSKSVRTSKRPEWRERFQLRLRRDYCLHVSLRDKGKQKNPMGSCVIDLSTLEKERTHEIWEQLEDGYGLIHLSVTMCTIQPVDRPVNNASLEISEYCEKSRIHVIGEKNVVGVLHVVVMGAKGLGNKTNAYCVVEIDNERVQTHRTGNGTELKWEKSYMFNVHDVTSTLDLRIYDGSFSNDALNESLGKVSIPLLRIMNGEMHWYALKDRNKRNIAKGNCPRVLLQMTLVWNPVKAAINLFQPKEMKYIQKPTKFDMVLVYNNIKFVANFLNLLSDLNESYKALFEWDDMEISLLSTVVWVLFCYYIRLWAVPLLLLLPFIFGWFRNSSKDSNYGIRNVINKDKQDKRFAGKLHDMQKMTFTITDGIEYIASHMEKLYNLVTFKVPFLTYVAMTCLLIGSVALYVIPFNFLLLSLGVYKFTRKYLNPNRVLNNDLLDFFARIPDNEVLKDWKELNVPEPKQDDNSQKMFTRSISTST